MHRARDRGARDEVAAELRKDDPLAHRARLVAGAADSLKAARHGRRRLDLHDQIDRAHVDAELQRGGGHERADAAGLQEIFHFAALGARERPVM